MKSILFSVLCILFSSSIAKAQWTGGGSGSSSSSSAKSLRFRLLASLKYQYANLGSKDDSVKSRALNGLGVDGLAGLGMGPFLVGAGAEYSKYFQMKPAKEFDDTNLSGSALEVYGSAGLAFSKFLLLGRYIVSSTYTLDKKTTAGNKVEYTTPESAYAASLLYRPGGSSFWSIDYKIMTYSKAKSAGTTMKLSSDSSMEFSSLGLSYGFMF